MKSLNNSIIYNRILARVLTQAVPIDQLGICKNIKAKQIDQLVQELRNISF